MTVIRCERSPLGGILRYRGAEHSFAFDATSPTDLAERAGGHLVTSVAIGTLQIEFGVYSRRALFVWGYHPRHNWRTGRLDAPAVQSGTVLLTPDIPLESGVSVQIARVNEWSTIYDSSTGWVRVSPPDARFDDELALIAHGIAIGELDGRIHSVWLNPAFE